MTPNSQICFLVRGPDPEPYTVTVERCARGEVVISCTCPTGRNGGYCKHRFDILRGDVKGLVSENAAEVGTVRQWRMSGS